MVEGCVEEFMRIYIYLGALKEGFIKGCGRVIDSDGHFWKTEHGRLLLNAVGMDFNNGMYSVAYVVV